MPTDSTLRLAILKSVLGTNKLKRDFETLYQANEGNWAALQLKLNETDSPYITLLPKLAFTKDLAEWTGDNAPLVEVYQKNPQTNSLRDIALNSTQSSFEADSVHTKNIRI